MKKNFKAFTLSEVLLVLSVIGVVAALTIPTLINKVSKDQNVAKLKKEYSVLSQAFNLLLADNGGDITAIFSNGADSGANVMNAFATKLNIIKNCGTSTGCWYTTPRYNLSGGAFENNFEAAHISQYGKAIMADGVMILAVNISSNCSSNGGIGPLANSVCGEFLIDLNGAKYGWKRFLLYLDN